MPAPLFLYLVPYLHQFSAVKQICKCRKFTFFCAVWNKFTLYLFKFSTAPSIDTDLECNISTKAQKSTLFNAQFTNFLCKFDTHFGYILYNFDSDLVWRMQLMIIKLKIRVVCVGNF